MSHVRGVLLRGDGGPRIGAGHLARLKAISGALESRGARVHLVSRTQQIGLAGQARVQRLDGGRNQGGDDPEGQLPVDDQLKDAARTVAALEGAEVEAALVDHYQLGGAWEQAVRAAGVSRVAAIDDLQGRSHTVDLLIDPNLGAHGPLNPAGPGRLLRGPAYVPLGEDHRRFRGRATSTDQRRLLVALGGGRSGIAPNLATALRAEQRLSDVAIDFIVPDRVERDLVAEALRGRDHASVVGRVPSLAPFLVEADVAIGAGGITSWERLRHGVPSVTVAISPNQVRTCRAVSELGLALWVDSPNDSGLLAAAAADALVDTALRDRTRAIGPLLVDGRGAERVALALLPPPGPVQLRPATIDDASAILALSSDRQTERAMWNPLPTSLSSFMDWLRGTLDNSSVLLLVADSAAGLTVGQIQFQRHRQDVWEVRFALDAAARGNGWTVAVVRGGVARLRSRHPDANVVALLRSGDPTTGHMLEKLGFKPDPFSHKASELGLQSVQRLMAYVLPAEATLP